MEEYNEFQFGLDNQGRWFIVFPSGFKAFPPGLTDEASVKARIDALIADLGAPGGGS